MKTRILTILIALMIASPVYAQQCNFIFENPTANAGADDLVDITVGTTNDALDDGYTYATEAPTYVIGSSFTGVTNCINNAPNVPWGGLFYYTGENHYAGPKTVIGTKYNLATGNYVTIAYNAGVTYYIASDGEAGFQVIARPITDNIGAALTPVDFTISTDGTVYVLFNNALTINEVNVASFSESGNTVIVNWITGIYVAPLTSVYGLGIAGVNEAEDKVYIITKVSNPSMDVVMFSIDAADGSVDSNVFSTTSPLAAPINAGKITFNADNNVVTYAFTTQNRMRVGSITPDANGNLQLVNVNFGYIMDIDDDAGSWGDPGEQIITGTGYVVTAVDCQDQAFSDAVCLIAYDASTGANRFKEMAGNVDLPTGKARLGLDNDNIILTAIQKTPSKVDVYTLTDTGTQRWGGEIDNVVTSLNVVGFINIAPPANIHEAVVGGQCSDGPCIFFLNKGTGAMEFAFSNTMPNLNPADQATTGAGFASNNANCFAFVTDGGVSVQAHCTVYQNYPDPAPEFSLTTMLLATLLAGGLVLFVVRRRYK